MSAYAIFLYDVTDPERYSKYNPGSMNVIMGTIEKHGGRILSAGTDAQWGAGQRQVCVVIEFPTPEAAAAWKSDPEYATVIDHRLESTSNRIEVIAPQLVMPS